MPLVLGGGDDIKQFFKEINEVGYGVAWRVLDAQYFGVPQRRRRVFAVGYLGDWRPAAAVLFERESLRGITQKSEQDGQGTSSGIEASHGISSGGGTVFAKVAATLAARDYKDVCARRAGSHLVMTDSSNNGGGSTVFTKVAGTLLARDYKDTDIRCCDSKLVLTNGLKDVSRI